MSSTVQLVSIITPLPGKTDEILQLLEPHNKFIEASQPDTLQYELFKEANGEGEILVYIGIFKNMAALEGLRSTGEHKALLTKAAGMGLLACPPETKVLTPIGGFSLRK